MLYNPPTGSTDPNAAYDGKNVAAGKQGSRIPPKAVEMPQRELVGIEVEAGLTPTNDDPRQVLRAIRSGHLWTFNDTSTVANRIAITAITPHTVLKKNNSFKVWPAFTNTGACTIAVNQIADVPLTRRDGTALQGKDLVAGIPFECIFDGQVMRLASFAQGEVSRIVANPILYVRPDGSDTNKGDGNNAAQAFKSIGAALAFGVAFLAYAGTLLTIQLGIPGDYEAPGTSGVLGANATLLGGVGTVQIVGDALNQDAYRIVGAGVTGNNGIIHASFTTNLTLRGLSIINNSPNTFDTLRAATNCVVSVENVTFGGLNGNVRSHICSSDGGITKIGAGCKATSSMARMLWGNGGGITLAAAFTLVGSLAFSDAFCLVESNGRFLNGGGSFSGGSVTGKRYSVYGGGTINTVGGGANFFPGTVAGTSFSADQYQ